MVGPGCAPRDQSAGIQLGAKGRSRGTGDNSPAVLGLAVGATTVMRANQTGLYTTIATNLAQDRLEELKSRTPANINTTGSPENVPGTGMPVTFNRSWTVTPNCNSVAGLTCINVTVSWTDYTSHNVTVSSAVKE